MSGSAFRMVARTGVSEQLVFGQYRNTQAGRADSVGEPALPGSKGLGLSSTSPQYQQADTARDSYQQGNPGQQHASFAYRVSLPTYGPAARTSLIGDLSTNKIFVIWSSAVLERDCYDVIPVVAADVHWGPRVIVVFPPFSAYWRGSRQLNG
jgi:hypothetical protein